MNLIWHSIVEQAQAATVAEPSLASFYHAHIISHPSLAASISYILAESLGSAIAPAALIRDVVSQVLHSDPGVLRCIEQDLDAVFTRDPACASYLMPLLYFKGFKALQCHRIAHYLWNHHRQALALFLQSMVSEQFHVDIHPAARIGSGILLDHATGVVIGETTVIGDNVSLLHSVTLGGSGADKGCKRHPTIETGVLIAAGAKVLGPVVVGSGAKVAAGSVVVTDVAANATVAGVPAKVVRTGMTSAPALDMTQAL